MHSHLYSLLHLLADGRFHSGDDLGEKLGVSRAAVWKTLRKAPALGVDLHSVKGKGYRLSRPLELFEREKLLGFLRDAAGPASSGGPGNGVELDLLLSVDSTNTYVMEKVRAGTADLSGGKFFVCLAERQTAGRGRRGRDWISPFGHNIYLTMAREFNAGAAELQGLSLVTGLALVRVLNRHGAPGLRLKWPNDVFHRDKKLAGILLEITGDLGGQCQLLLGIGLNLHLPAETAAAIDQPWTDLQSIMEPLPGRNLLAAELIVELMAVLAQFEVEGFAPFQRDWLKFDMLLDKPVILKKNEERSEPGISGICRGVDGKGALLLETEDGLEAFHAGELSARLGVEAMNE